MTQLSPLLRQSFFGISPEETHFARRRFRISDSDKVSRLETVGERFLTGYNAALAAASITKLEEKLEDIDSAYRGFAYEGAAMGLCLLDNLSPWRSSRLLRFRQGKADEHIYMIHVGAGWALARLPWTRYRLLQSIDNLDPLLKWLAIDGLGFHEGYFHPQRYFHSQVSLSWLPGYAKSSFTQGLGRCLWFVEGAAIEHIAQTISRLPEKLHADLWSGVGLACAYAGGVTESEIKQLKTLARSFLPQLAQGAAFAAKTRQRAGNFSFHTEMACRILCHCTSEEAALITDAILEDLPKRSEIPLYEVWRQRIQQEFSNVGDC
jgi:hypothetical protein